MVGGNDGRMLSKQRQPDGGDRGNHGHAHFPWIQHDQGSDLTASHDGGHARSSFGWGSIHRSCGHGFGSQRRKSGMMRLVK